MADSLIVEGHPTTLGDRRRTTQLTALWTLWSSRSSDVPTTREAFVLGMHGDEKQRGNVI